MKVLWFTNIELDSVRRRHALAAEGGGGWMESLRAALCAQGSVRLGIAAAGPRPFEPFDDEGVRYYHLDAPPSLGGVAGVAAHWMHRTGDGPLLAQASRVIDDFRPDLIHVHGSERPFGLLARTSAIPVLVSLQGILLVYSRAYLSGIPIRDVVNDVVSLEFVKGRGLVHGCWDMRAAARRELRILQGCSYFAGRTEWDKGITSVVNPRARYYRAEEILRPEFFIHEWRQRADAPFLVYTTGGPAPYKGLVNLLQAIALLRESARPEIRLRVSGQIQDTNMWPIVQRAVDRMRLRDVVDWLGPLAPVDIVAELQATSVYVHPSIVENSPNSLAEAMILGVPCVACSAGGVPSLVKDGHEGLLCSPNDVYGLAGTICAIEAEPALAARLGANARSRALQRHEPRAVAQATIAMYEDIVSRHRPGA